MRAREQSVVYVRTCWVGCVNDHWFELCEAESDCVYVVAATIGFESCASERAVLCVCMCVAMDGLNRHDWI